MIHYDERNRIVKIDVDTAAFRGHSVCNSCEKDMKIVWDTVCFYCRKTFCYDCISIQDEKFICKNCEVAHEESRRELENENKLG